jgi:plasmid stability protein
LKLAIELPATQANKLREEAARLGISAEDYVRAVLADLLAGSEAEFRAAAERVLRKNQELYKRLA